MVYFHSAMQFCNRIFHNIYFLPTLIFIIFTLIFSLNSLYHHFTYNTNTFDLGIYSQIIYRYSHSFNLYSPLKHMILLADHFEPILIVLSPIVKFFPASQTLLIIQALFVSLSAIPLYLICLDKTKSTLLSFLLIISYLTSKGILSAMNFDFHSSTISVLPISLILFFWYFQKWKLYWFTLVFSLLFKEDLPIFIAGLGIYQILNVQKTLGLKTLLFAITSFYLIKFKLMAMLWTGGAQSYIETSTLPLNDPFTLLILFFTKPFIFIDQIFNNPVKITTVIDLNSTFALLPLLSPFFWLTVFPDLYLRFTSTYMQIWTTNFHHNANLIPFLVVSTVIVIVNYKIPQKPIILLLVILLLFGGLNPKSIFWSIFHANFANIKTYEYIDKALLNIPSNAKISAGSSIIPHLIDRDYVYMYPEVIDADYIIIDPTLSSYPLENEDLVNNIDNLIKSPNWQVEKIKNLYIFKKK